MPADPTVVFDCRWLGIGGPGKATELLLRGMAEAPPPGRWILWGPEPAISAVAWPGVDIRPIGDDPRLLLGQRHALAVPKGDFYVFMHQQRPLRNVPAITFVHDTIPLHGPLRPSRELKRLFLRWVAHSSRLLITISDYSRQRILDELGPPPERVALVRFPFDAAFVDRVLARRQTVATEDTALFIGGFLPHKNLPRLLAAFGDTEFCRRGGRLVLVGATAAQADRMLERLDDRQRRFVTLRHSCSQAEMDDLYAGSRFLVQPSLEEGFGLPVWEAMCCGLPVCVSDGGALPEVVNGFAEPFPARSVPAMTAAIDACAEGARTLEPGAAAAQARVLRERAPTVAEFGAQFAALVLERACGSSPSGECNREPSGRDRTRRHRARAGDLTGLPVTTAAVIVNYRTKELTLDAVRSVLGEPEVDQVVVVDNGSGDGSAAYLREAVTDRRLRVLESETNRGYGPAVNLAVAACESPLVLVMNSDATLRPGSMARLTKTLVDDDRVAVVAPAVYGPDGRHLQPGVYGRLPSRRDVLLTHRWVHTRADDPVLAREPEWVSGVAMLVRRSDFLAVDGFDERFTMYLEDVDLCRRLREAGRSIRREPAAGVVHLLGKSWSSRQEQRRCFHESKIRYFEKLGAGPLELAYARLVGRVRAGLRRSR